MTISRRKTLPLYHQLNEFITERIESGDWLPGHRMPTEKELSNEFSVSRTTVRQAMQLLENEGLVERIQGKGTFVGRPKIAQNLGTMGSMPLMANAGSSAAIQFISLNVVAPSAAVASRLSLPAGEKVYELTRTMTLDGEPLMLITAWMPVSLFPDLRERFVETLSMRQTLRELYGIQVVRQQKVVEVTILDDQEAETLHANAGAPALLLSYLSQTQDHAQPCEYRKMLVRGDRCKYYLDLDQPELLL